MDFFSAAVTQDSEVIWVMQGVIEMSNVITSRLMTACICISLNIFVAKNNMHDKKQCFWETVTTAYIFIKLFIITVQSVFTYIFPHWNSPYWFIKMIISVMQQVLLTDKIECCSSIQNWTIWCAVSTLSSSLACRNHTMFAMLCAF